MPPENERIESCAVTSLGFQLHKQRRDIESVLELSAVPPLPDFARDVPADVQTGRQNLRLGK